MIYFKVLLKAVFAWLPFLAGIIIFLFINLQVNQKVNSAIYDNYLADVCYHPASFEQCDSNRLLSNINQKIDSDSKQAEKNVNHDIDEKKDALNSGVAKAPDGINNAFEKSVPKDLGLKTERCKFYQLGCLAKNYVKKKLNNYYSRQREKIKESLNNEVAEKVSKVNKKTTLVSVELKKASSKSINELNNNTKSFITESITNWKRFEKLFNYFLLLIAVVSFLETLLRVYYSHTGNIISFRKTTREENNLSVAESIHYFQGSYLRLDFADLPVNFSSDYKYLYISSHKNIDNFKPKTRVSQVFSLFFSRIWHLIFTHRVDKDNIIFDAVPYISTEKSKMLCVWKLSNNKVIFDMEYLVGFSDGIKFKGGFSSLSSLFNFRRIRFKSAQGSGYLIFEINGSYEKDNDKVAVIPSRHVAFDYYAKFQLLAETNPIDTMISGVTIKRDESFQGIIDVDHSNKKAYQPIIRYFKFFIPSTMLLLALML